MKEELKKVLKAVGFSMFGDYDEWRTFFFKDGKLVDSFKDENEIERKIVIGIIKGKDGSKNNIMPSGGSLGLQIDKNTKAYIENFNIEIFRAFNELTKERMLLVYCSMGGET